MLEGRDLRSKKLIPLAIKHSCQNYKQVFAPGDSQRYQLPVNR
jgi:hypothetical protein